MDSRFKARYALNKKMCCKEYQISKIKNYGVNSQ